MAQRRRPAARSRNGSDDDDDADVRVQALPVSSAPVSLDGPPTSADEYLRRVKFEAENMPDVLHAVDLASRCDEQQRTLGSPPQHSQSLPEVEPSATPPALRPHPVWMLQLLHTFSRQRRVLRSVPTSPTSPATGSRLPAPADSSGWESILWPSRSTGSASLRPTLNNLRRLQPQHVVKVLGLLIACTSTRVLSSVQRTANHGDVLAAECEGAQGFCLTEHCCAWLFGLLACLDSVLAQQASIASDLRLLFRLAVFERSQIAAAAVAPSRFTAVTGEQAPTSTVSKQQKRSVAAINVLITVLSRFFKVGADLDEYI